MKRIKLKFTDMWDTFDEENNFFIDLLEERYEVELSDNPEYVVYSVYGENHLNYNCIRIFWAGENVRPDFNICDYALGWDYMEFGDRYIRGMPFISITNFGGDFIKSLKEHKPIKYMPVESKCLNDITSEYEEKFLMKYPDIDGKKFCNFIFTNGMAESIRKDFFYELSKYKKVDSIGKYLKNVEYTLGRSRQDKYEIQKMYKFSIAFENTYTPGYTTEKIYDAFVTGTIPIYWGNPKIGEELNEKSFINCHQYNNLQEVIDVIKKIDNDDELYIKYTKEPIFKNNIFPEYMKEENIKKFLYNVFDQDIGMARRRNEWWDTFTYKRDKYKAKKRLTECYIQSCFKGKKSIGWGTGNGIILLKDSLRKMNINYKIDYFIDSDESKQNNKMDGIPIYPPTKLIEEKKGEIFIVVLSYSYYDEIKKILLSYDYKEYEDFIGLKHL